MTTLSWSDRVAEVFTMKPRLLKRGTSYSRKAELDALKKYFSSIGESICIDGPSGAGKTSLALTFVAVEQIHFAYVQITKYLDWRGFCRQVIDPNVTNIEESSGTEIEFGIQQLLPFAKLKVTLGEKSSTTSSEDYVQTLSSQWTEIDVAQEVLKKNICLIVDDLDQASEEVLARLAAICKYLLLGNPKAKNARCLLVGTGDIYRRVLSANEALTLRLNEVSLGSFALPRDSWSFLARGFNALNIHYPGGSQIDKHHRTNDILMIKVYEAADGLPKSLNKLGQLIALVSANGVTSATIRQACDDMVIENWDFHSEEYPEVIDILRKSEPAKALVRILYEQGACLVFKKSTLLNTVISSTKYSRSEVDLALHQLVECNFITLTGSKGKQVVFPADSVATHTLGVVLNNRHRFPEAAYLLGDLDFSYQMRLDFDAESDFSTP